MKLVGRPRFDPKSTPTAERLLLAAELEFGARGYARARLEDIAARAGISRASLLYHFRSKQLLYAAVVDHVFLQLADALNRSISAEGSFEQRFIKVIESYLGFLNARPALAQIILREILDAGRQGTERLKVAGLPVLELVEVFVQEHGQRKLREPDWIREALLQIVTGALVRSASNPALREAFWGEVDHTLALARSTLLR